MASTAWTKMAGGGTGAGECRGDLFADMPAFADAADHDFSSVVQDFDAEPDQLRKLLAEVLLEIEKSVNFDLHRFCGGLQNKFRIHFKSFPDDKFPETIYNDFEI